MTTTRHQIVSEKVCVTMFVKVFYSLPTLQCETDGFRPSHFVMHQQAFKSLQILNAKTFA